MKTYAIDFETEYGGELSVKTLGSKQYFKRLSLDQIYLVSVCGEGFEYVGSPKDLDWKFVEGSRVLHHNAGFDYEAMRRLREHGLSIPHPTITEDTADLAAYCGIPRGLKNAAFAMWGKVVDKDIRDKSMKDKAWNDMPPELQKEVKDYALEDARLTLRLWEELFPRWPDEERLISRLAREWAAEGIHVDQDAMNKAIAHLKHTIWGAARELPWVIADDAPPLSPKALALECRKVGITTPKSLAIGDEECDLWMEQHGDKYKWVSAMRDWRRANAILKKLEAMQVRVIDGRFRYEIKTYGAGMTLRWSGAGGVNVQNFSSKELFGINMRDMLVAAPGHVLIAADLAQIEPRVASFLAKEDEELAQMAAGVSPYIVYARQAMGLGPNETWEKSDPRYKIAKMSVLGASYCAGHHRFADLLRAVGMEDILEAGPEKEETREDYAEYLEVVGNPDWLKLWREADEALQKKLLRSWEIIQQFRRGRPKLVALWGRLSRLAKTSADKGENISLDLPSGRSLVYKHARKRVVTGKTKSQGTEVVADIIRNGMVQTSRIHQGILIENLCQSIARDAFRDCLINVSEAGYKVIFHVHDELVLEVPKHKADTAKEDVLNIMSRSPSWAKNLPVEAEATIADKYSKAK